VPKFFPIHFSIFYCAILATLLAFIMFLLFLILFIDSNIILLVTKIINYLMNSIC
jgi:hypothetical protein